MKHPEIEKRIQNLLSKMTLEEKVGQLHQQKQFFQNQLVPRRRKEKKS